MNTVQLDHVFWYDTGGVLQHATFKTEQSDLAQMIRDCLPFSMDFWQYDENFGWFRGNTGQTAIQSLVHQDIPNEIKVLSTLLNLNWRI